jgi:hypothetical protein
MAKKSVEDMEKKELLQTYHLLRRRYESVLNAIENLMAELSRTKETVQKQENDIIQRDTKIAFDKVLMQELADNQNKQKDEMAEEIRLLKSEIRELRNGDNN